MNDDWSLSSDESGGGGRSSMSNATPKFTSGARSRRGSVDGGSVSGVSRSAILPTASINASNFRPSTGLARVENRRSSTSSSSSSAKLTTLIVESAGYYREMIQSKIVEIETELGRLRTETEITDVHSSSRIALDGKHDNLLTTVRKLEANLADYNLAREYARSGTAPAEIKKSTMTIVGTNNKMEKEIDAIFFKRKKVEDEIGSVEAEVKHLNDAFESKLDDEEADDGKVRLDLYRCLVTQIKAVIAETEQQEDDIVLLRHKVKTIDGNGSDQSIKRVDRMKKELEQVEEDIRVVLMTDDEARKYLLSKIVDMQMSTKEHEDELSSLDSELQRLNLLQKVARLEKLMGGTEMANARLVDKDNSLKQYLDQTFPGMKAELENEQRRLLSSIEILRSEINKREIWALNMKLPSKEELDLMKSEVAFTRKHIDSQKETLAILRELKDKRIDELARVELLGQKISDEMVELEEKTTAFYNAFDKFGDLDEQQAIAQETIVRLSDMNNKHATGIQLLDKMLLLPLSTTQHSDWRELKDLKSKLCTQGDDLMKLQESTTKEDYSAVKAECLQLMEKINQLIISNLELVDT